MRAVQGVDLTDEELLSYISESSTMSKSIEEYEGAVTILPFPSFSHPHLLILSREYVSGVEPRPYYLFRILYSN